MPNTSMEDQSRSASPSPSLSSMSERSEGDVTEPRIPCRSASEGKEKQQEGRAMATLDRKVPSPEAFLGKPWSIWIDAAKIHCSDNVDLEETGKEGGKSREVMRLNKEDMHLFGHYPAHDDFYLVVCNICNQVVKPQVFQSHCERRHVSMCKPSTSPASPPSNTRASHLQMKTKTCISSHNPVNSNSKPFKAPKDNLLTSNNKQHTVFSSKVSRDKPCGPVPVVSLEKIPNLVKADGANVKMNSATNSSSTAASSASSLAKQSVLPKPVPPSPEKILNGKGISSLDKKHQNGTKSSNKPYKRLSEREFDPNKHCGVLDPETKKPCTRSLTCKTHTLNHRRAVPGRKKPFDILLAEHKARSREKEVTKDKEHPQNTRETHQNQPAPAQEQSSGPSASSTSEPKVTSPAKARLPNSVLPRQSTANIMNSTSSVNHSAFVPDTTINTAAGDLASRLSSDEGELEGVEEAEKLDCYYSGHHPKPLAFCSFGSRLMGRGYYVFDRRWDRFRFALNSMVEKHLNSQMWKKIPPAADSPMPSPAAAHSSSPFPASVLQPFSSPNSVYHPSPPTNSRTTSSYVLSNAAFVSSSDTNSVTSHTTAFPHVTSTLNIMDSTFKAPSAISPVLAMSPLPSHKLPKTKTGKSSKVKDLSSRNDEPSSNKKKKPQTPSSTSSSSLPLQTSSSSTFSGSHKKNCILNSSVTINSYQATSSYNSVSVHNANNGTSPISAKLEPPVRTSLSGSSTDSIKHMSMVVSSIDSSLSVSSLVHHPGEHTLAVHNAVSSMSLPFDKSEGKKRKNSSASSKACKITKMPGMNSVHKKSTTNLISSVPDPPNSSLSRQMGKSSSVALSQSASSCTSNPAHNKQTTNRTGRIRTLP
ncbi:ataxin-7-like protein 1 isoform X3 [Pseudophryne corroboree]|uniref:ataxin-7-like protein 1 isoform X3 n=1 Tax=Pseudophryne corroboree TaxID=495146 RepID=UPI003081347F